MGYVLPKQEFLNLLNPKRYLVFWWRAVKAHQLLCCAIGVLVIHNSSDQELKV